MLPLKCGVVVFYEKKGKFRNIWVGINRNAFKIFSFVCALLKGMVHGLSKQAFFLFVSKYKRS